MSLRKSYEADGKLAAQAAYNDLMKTAFLLYTCHLKGLHGCQLTELRQEPGQGESKTWASEMKAEIHSGDQNLKGHQPSERDAEPRSLGLRRLSSSHI